MAWSNLGMLFFAASLTRYPEAAAAALKSETEAVRLREEDAKRKAEEERLKAEAEAKRNEEEERLKAEAEAKRKVEQEAEQRRVAAVAAAATAFRRRCLQAAAAACTLVLLLVLHRSGRLPLRLRRLITVLLFLLLRR